MLRTIGLVSFGVPYMTFDAYLCGRIESYSKECTMLGAYERDALGWSNLSDVHELLERYQAVRRAPHDVNVVHRQMQKEEYPGTCLGSFK